MSVPESRPHNWWDTEDPVFLRAELEEVDEHLDLYGIDYPRGARGVGDLMGMARRDRQWLGEIAELARAYGWSGDMDTLFKFIAARMGNS